MSEQKSGRELAAGEIVYALSDLSDPSRGGACPLCTAAIDGTQDSHDQSCPWRLAREWSAAVDEVLPRKAAE